MVGAKCDAEIVMTVVFISQDEFHFWIYRLTIFRLVRKLLCLVAINIVVVTNS